MKKDHKNALVPYLSPLAVLALSFGYTVGWGSFVMPPIRYTPGDAPKSDMLLTDMWMPEMDGETLVKEVRNNPKIADLKVFVPTADVEMRHTYADLGFTGLVLKPVTFENPKQLFVAQCQESQSGDATVKFG